MNKINNNFLILFLKIIVPIAMIILIATYFLLQEHTKEKETKLCEKALVLSSLISKVALFDKKYSKESNFNKSSSEATLHQVQKTFDEFSHNKNIHYRYFLAIKTDTHIDYAAYSTLVKPSSVDIDDLSKAVAARKAFDGKSGVELSHDHNKKKVFTAYMKVPNSNWVLIISQSYYAYMLDFLENLFYMLVIITAIGIILYFVLKYNEKQNLKRIYATESRYKDLVESTDDWVWEVDMDGTYTYVSSQIENILGYKTHDIVGKQPFHFMSKSEAKRVSSIFENIVKNQSKIKNLENTNIHKDGHEVVMLTNGTPFFDIGGQLTGFRGIDRDISNEKRKQREIEQMAYYDALTGLANKKTISHRIEEEVSFAKRHNIVSAILFLDLDSFKYINDSLGHIHGDEVLKVVSQRLKDVSRDFDVVSRVGGDEFIILVRGKDKPSQKSKIGFRYYIDRIIREINKTIIINNEENHLGVSIGIALLPQDGETADDLIKHADSAMYSAKEDGKNKAVFYNESLQLEADTTFEFKNKIIKAFNNKEFILHYQEQFDLEENLVGYEALMRWEHPTDGLIRPDKFLPYLEKFGFSLKLDKYICDKVYNDMAGFSQEHPNLQIAINITGNSFSNKSFLDYIKSKINTFAIDTSLITLEITEEILIKNIDDSNIQELKDLGFGLSIDDFGTGYSSLSYLSNIQFDEIKVDMSFIQAINKSEKDREICKLILNMCRALDVRVVAEGVETKEQFEFVKAEGASVVQGYYFSKPKTLKEVLKS